MGSAAGLVRALRRAVPGVGQTGEVHAAKSADEDRVAVLGDSVTFGEAIATEDTFCRRTEGLLNRARTKVHARVFNFGVSGYSVKQIAATV